jgi:anti-sigma factor RsiW
VHQEWTDKLSDYLDGELPDDERRAVDAHLRGCPHCAAVLDDLKRVVSRAQHVAGAPRPPHADLWGGIAARIDAERRGAAGGGREASDDGRVARFAPRPSRRVSFTLPQLAAAAAIVAAVSGGLVWKMRPATGAAGAPMSARADDGAVQPSTDSDADAAQPFRAAASDAAGNRVVPVGMADAQYDAAVADLERALNLGRGRLDASTIAIVEHNLQIIDQAIDQAREALTADPANTYLSGHLVEARRRKLELLRRATALTSESN